MEKLSHSQAFARFGADMTNANGSVCADGRDGALVVSLWSHRIDERAMEYRDTFVRWSEPGRQELRRRLAEAHAMGRALSLVLAVADHPLLLEYGTVGSRIQMHYVPREELVGRVVQIDDAGFVIALSRR